MLNDLSGLWTVTLSDGSVHQAQFPGTLDENSIGHPDAERIATRLTRVCTYEGPAACIRTWDLPVPEGRLFIEVERSRALSLAIDGTAVAPQDPQTISTPTVFEVTGLLKEGSEIRLTCDNSYPGMPHDNIVYSSAATDETQTNWNGLLGFLRLRTEADSFIEGIRVYPHVTDTAKTLDVYIDVNALQACSKELTLVCPALAQAPTCGAQELISGRQTFCFKDLPVRPDALLWDAHEQGAKGTERKPHDKAKRNKCTASKQKRPQRGILADASKHPFPFRGAKAHAEIRADRPGGDERAAKRRGVPCRSLAYQGA